MNYYPFHIGDYASATRHLSWDEDCAYRRLLDVYYTTEKPLPLDIKQVCRLAVASSKVQRDAVAVVLEEFFEKTDAGWINARADEEIDAMRTKQAAGEEKAAHEAGRMSRYRERRAAMFQALRAVDVVPAWDVPMKELQRLHDQHCNATGGDPATHLQREQAVSGDAPATAVPTPTPTPVKEEPPTGVQGAADAPPRRPPSEKAAQAVDIPDWMPVQQWEDFVAMRRAKGKKSPFTVAAAKGVVAELGRLREQGQDVAGVLQQSLINGWSGVFPVKASAAAQQQVAGIGVFV